MDDIQAQVPNTIKQWIVLSSGWDGMPIAFHLQMEGKKVIVGQVQDKSELKQGEKEEDEDKKERLSQYDGMLQKYPAAKLVKALKKVSNKDDYFIFCDQNQLWPYAEELLAVGFTKGLFPTKQDFDMEKEREAAMEFVQENYPDIQIIPHQKVATVDEAREVVESAETPLVIQSEGDHVSTIVGPDDVEQSKITLLAALDKYEKDYSKGEIIIKEKLVAPIEITPQIVFWNGQPVFTDLDIETKNIGDGENNGNQVGCGTNLIIRTEMGDPINQIAFPAKVHEMAKKHTGIMVWDLSIYITENGLYFGEFCSNRFGYDSLMTEMTMSHGPSEFFEFIMAGINPLRHFTFGTALRVFNLNRQKDFEITVGSWKPTWLYEVKQVDDKFLSVGDCWDLGVITGRGNTVEEAVDNLYDNYETLTFKEKYSRTKSDFLADYPTSIVRRFTQTNGIYYTVPGIEAEPKEEREYSDLAKQIKDIENTVREGIPNLQKAMKDIGTVKKTLTQKVKEKLYGQK